MRCGFVGRSVLYFRKGSHRAILVAASLCTYGIGGVAYYLARRKHPVCPACGVGWEHAQEVADRDGLALAAKPEGRPPRGGAVRRVAGAALAVLGSFLIVGAIATTDYEILLPGSAFGLAGSGLLLSGWRALQRRRQAVFNRLCRKVLLLAQHRSGAVTVTEVATELDLSLPAAEKLLDAMDDGLRVKSEVSKEGVIYYEFPEVKHGANIRRLEPVV